MLSDFGMCADVVARTDSSSGFAVGSRRGLGRLRHVQTRYLWVQQRAQQGDFRLEKEPGDTDEKRMTNLLTMIGYVFKKGAQHWRRKRSDELEIEELYVTEENCKLFLNDSRYCFQQYGVCSSKISLKQAELRSGTLERE